MKTTANQNRAVRLIFVGVVFAIITARVAWLEHDRLGPRTGSTYDEALAWNTFGRLVAIFTTPAWAIVTVVILVCMFSRAGEVK